MTWQAIRDGKSLPKVGQEILFVEDVRGTQEEWWRGFWKRRIEAQETLCLQLDSNTTIVSPLEETEIKPMLRSRHGWVHEVEFEQDFGWWISVRGSRNWNHLVGMVSHADYITHWMPMPAPDRHD